MDGTKNSTAAAAAVSVKTFLSLVKLPLFWFFIHEFERLVSLPALIMLAEGVGVRVRGGVWRWMAASSPPPFLCPIRAQTSSASMKDPEPTHKKKKKGWNGSSIQTSSLIKPWINVNSWRHAIKSVTWRAFGGCCGQDRSCSQLEVLKWALEARTTQTGGSNLFYQATFNYVSFKFPFDHLSSSRNSVLKHIVQMFLINLYNRISHF